jgi:hypothetical protein
VLDWQEDEPRSAEHARVGVEVHQGVEEMPGYEGIHRSGERRCGVTRKSLTKFPRGAAAAEEQSLGIIVEEFKPHPTQYIDFHF